MKTYRFFLALLILLITQNALAENYYAGGGISLVSLNSDHPSIGDQNGFAFNVIIGKKYEKWAFDASASLGMYIDTGVTPGIYYPPDEAEYGTLDFGVKRYFKSEANTKFSPWLGVGLGMHFITWETYYYNVFGGGLSFSGGFDYQVAPKWQLRGEFVYHNFSSDDDHYDDFGYEGPWSSPETQINFMVIYEF